jgi:nifR3 family TIM-barrel protein
MMTPVGDPIHNRSPASTVPFPDEDPRLTIGNRVLASRYFLAPLAGYTHLAFRTVLRALGGIGLATTDLVHARQLISGSRKSKELIATSPADRPLSVQIYGPQIDELLAAAHWLEEQGYRGIEINMGCPMAKVNAHGGGARLLCDAEKACRLVASVVEAVDLPVSVKMRTGWDSESVTSPLLAREFERVGVAAVILHGRTRQQGFRGNVDLDAIRDTVHAVETMPIIGNGDVRTVDDAFRMRRDTGCAAVAIGRGAMLDPWIFAKLERAVRGLPDNFEPTRDQQIDFLLQHFRLMTAQHGEYSCVLFRKFAGWYGARFGIPEDLEDRLRRIESFNEFDQLVEEIHQRHGTRKSTHATALVKVPNGPVERW